MRRRQRTRQPQFGAKINAEEKYIVDDNNFKHLVEDLVNPKKYIVGTMMLSSRR